MLLFKPEYFYWFTVLFLCYLLMLSWRVYFCLYVIRVIVMFLVAFVSSISIYVIDICMYMYIYIYMHTTTTTTITTTTNNNTIYTNNTTTTIILIIPLYILLLLIIIMPQRSSERTVKLRLFRTVSVPGYYAIYIYIYIHIQYCYYLSDLVGPNHLYVQDRVDAWVLKISMTIES